MRDFYGVERGMKEKIVYYTSKIESWHWSLIILEHDSFWH